MPVNHGSPPQGQVISSPGLSISESESESVRSVSASIVNESRSPLSVELESIGSPPPRNVSFPAVNDQSPLFPSNTSELPCEFCVVLLF